MDLAVVNWTFCSTQVNHQGPKTLFAISGHFSDVNCCVYNEPLNELFTGGSDRNVLIYTSNSRRDKEYLEETGKSKKNDEEGTSLANTVTVDQTNDNWSSDDSSDEDD